VQGRWTSLSLWASLLLMLIAALFFLGALGLGQAARTFPLMVSSFTLLALLLVLIGELFPRVEHMFEINWTGGAVAEEQEQLGAEVLNTPGAAAVHLQDVPWRMVFTVFGSLLFLALGIFLAGFFVAVPVFILVFQFLYGDANWKGTVGLAIGSTVVIYALSTLIHTPLFGGVLFGAPVPPF
jgi:hypothetical protein